MVAFILKQYLQLLSTCDFYQAALYAANGQGQTEQGQREHVRFCLEEIATSRKVMLLRKVLDSQLLAPFFTYGYRKRVKGILDQARNFRRGTNVLKVLPRSYRGLTA